MRRNVSPVFGIAAACLAALCVLVSIPIAGATVPAIYDKRRAAKLGRGIERFTLARKGPEEAVNVVRIAHDAPFDLRAVPATGNIGAGLERTSAICRRVDCIVAVNGDFWKPGTDVPIGGVVSLGRLLRTPSPKHVQVTLSTDGGLRTGPLKIRAALVTDDLHTLPIAAVNRRPHGNELALFTPAVGRSTHAPKGTIELTLRAVRPKGVVALRRTTVVQVAEHGSPAGDAPIPADGAVLSGAGRGGRLLRDLLARIRGNKTSPEALLRIESNPDAVESIGGSPVLVRDGRPLPVSAHTSFTDHRHPRTLMGWTRKDEVLLVTVDGRQPGHSEGMTLAEAARLMVNLGASDAVNLDGGGSTTFVEAGKVMNRPSDVAVRTLRGIRIVHKATSGLSTIGNVERPVAIALAVVPRGENTLPTAPGVLHDLDVPGAVEAAAPNAADPASDPSGSTPEIVARPARGREALRAIALMFVLLGIAFAAGWSGYLHAHRALRPQAS
jgi:exopolysaccharide biosynthesis protein